MGEFFEIQNTLSFNKDKLTRGKEYDYITRTSQNQGIFQETGFVNQNNINESGTYSLGLLQMDFFYREKPWYAGQFVRKIIPKVELTKPVAKYFEVILNKLKERLLAGLVRDVDETFLTANIYLPTKNNQPDFEYMTNYVRQVEANYVRQVDNYLNILGYESLADVELTEEDYAVVEAWENSSRLEKKVSEIFTIITPKKKFNANSITLYEDEGFPYIVRTSKNNGIRGFLQEDMRYLNPENTIAFGQDTATMFYQKQPYFTGDKIKILEPILDKFDVNIAHYILTEMNNAFSTFAWGSSSFNVSILNNVKIQLPISNNEIDTQLMHDYIKVIEKKVIKNLKTELENRLAKYKEVTYSE